MVIILFLSYKKNMEEYEDLLNYFSLRNVHIDKQKQYGSNEYVLYINVICILIEWAGCELKMGKVEVSKSLFLSISASLENSGTP